MAALNPVIRELRGEKEREIPQPLPVRREDELDGDYSGVNERGESRRRGFRRRKKEW
jgi:hypothetical protein